MAGRTAALTIDDFGRVLVDLLEVDLGRPLDPADHLLDDWGLDSLQAFQTIIVIEALAELDVPPMEVPVITTLQDAYAYYCTARELADD